jgi:hypothetical protein
MFVWVGIGLLAPVTASLEIEAESPRDHHKPRRELGPAVVRESTKPVTVIPAKLLEDIDVRVHRVVPVLQD